MKRSEKREEAIRLRTQERKSLNEIVSLLGVSKSSVSGWLREFPLTGEERYQKMAVPNQIQKGRKYTPTPSKFWHLCRDFDTLTTSQKASISESAVLFRLLLLGLEVLKSPFDGSSADWVVRNPNTGKFAVVQVKCVMKAAFGMPMISLKRADGHFGTRRYEKEEFDFIVGYDLFSDTAFVFSSEMTKTKKTTISVTEESTENWNLLLGAVT